MRLGLIIVLAAAGCEPGAPSPTPSTVPHGGTLRVVVPNTEGLPPGYIPPDKTTIDVLSATSSSDAGELLRCCLARTLLSYNGQPTSSGGATLRPDLASGPPDVASDGLTWTFHLRQHLHYAPPLAATEITAADFVRAVRRTARRFFQVGGMIFGLWTALGGHGAPGIELAYIVRSPEEVTEVLHEALQAGGSIVRHAALAAWGGTRSVRRSRWICLGSRTQFGLGA